MKVRYGIEFVLLACMFFSIMGDGAWAQRRRLNPSGIRMGGTLDDSLPMPNRSLSRKMLKATYEQLTKDIQELSEVSTAMKEEVEKDGDEDILSLSIVKKAEQAEKLAKRIQNRMKNL